MAIKYDITHVVFMDLIKTIISTTGVAPAKGSLIRIALHAGEQCKEIAYRNYDEFVESFATMDNPISQIEGQAVYVGEGLFGLKQCPFSSLIGTFKEFYGTSPTNFDELKDEFNKTSRISEEYKIGTGSAVGPFCVFHQPLRSKIGAKIKIGHNNIEVIQLGCRSGNGKKAFSDAMIAIYGCSKDAVDTILDSYACCYGIREVKE